MADQLKPFAFANIDNVLVDIYTCPASTVGLCLSFILCNISGATINVEVTFLDSSTAVTTFLLFNSPILAGQSLVLFGDDNRQPLEAADKFRARAVTGTNVLDITGGVLEQAV